MGNVNLVTNPSFESGLTSWSFTNCSSSQDTTLVTPGVGTVALKCLANTTNQKMTATITVSGLTIGNNYTASFYVKTSPAGPAFGVSAIIGGAGITTAPIVSVDSFRRRFVGFQATATSTTFTITSEAGNVIGDIMWIDCVQVTQDGLQPYFDGSFPGCTWNGSANASASTAPWLAPSLAGVATTDEIVMVNGFLLNTLAFNISSKNGRYTTPAFRGDDISVPGANGITFVPNKPVDAGLWSLDMWVLGQHTDGTVPYSQDQRDVLADNFNRIVRQCLDQSNPVTIITWQPNGAILTTQATLVGTNSAIDATMNMGGRRAEFTLAFEILPGVWKDYANTTVNGTPSTAWSNQTLLIPQFAGGTALIDDAVLTVTGPITNPTLSNSITGTSVSYVGTVPSGQTWVVDCGAWTSKVNGVSVLANTTHSGHSRFLLIDRGSIAQSSPQITLSGSSTSTATNLSVTGSRKFLLG